MRSGENTETITVALAGNPNVGKSTLFNTLTGMSVHTGNWSGKTVGCEYGVVRHEGERIRLVDIPGTYSLFSRSEEERVARDFIAFGDADVTVVVCDACALRQNLNLVLQVMETGARCVVAVNLIDEARRKGVAVDIERLGAHLGVPVVATVGHKRKTLTPLVDAMLCGGAPRTPLFYPQPIEEAVLAVTERLPAAEEVRARYLALTLLFADASAGERAGEEINSLTSGACNAFALREDVLSRLAESGVSPDFAGDMIASALVARADELADAVVASSAGNTVDRTRKIDRILTGRVSAYPLMLALLALVFFITLVLSAYPSDALAALFSWLEGGLLALLEWVRAPEWLSDMLVLGLLRTVGQVIAVMLPPMAIFFPLFAILEDSGYLPRIAYNLDRPFACSGACGKQALTMCMGLGCNAVGIVGCRIIDSKRERVIAAVTNSLVPCNGRLPMLITLISVFYLYFMSEVPSLLVALTLSVFIVLGIAATLLCTLLLSRTAYKGEPSSFTIELPPYRRPRFLSVTLRALKEKCGSVLLRAVTVAAPVGLLVWGAAHVPVAGGTLLSTIASTLDPVGNFFGLDGAILLAFVLAIPANEIVIPMLFVIYTQTGSIPADVSLEAVREVLAEAGWGPVRAICCAVFALFHWPCSTSLITVYKETRSVKSLLISFLLPTVPGLLICFIISFTCGIIFG